MKRIYIRHADKCYGNGKSQTLKHDPDIIQDADNIGNIKALGRSLCQTHGQPDLIYCSPYLRARNTALIMASVLPKSPIHIRVDSTLSEYLGHHRNEKLDVTFDTRRHNVPHPENLKEFEVRVQLHDSRIQSCLEGERKVVWLITHGIFISFLSRLYFEEELNRNYLGYIILDENDKFKENKITIEKKCQTQNRSQERKPAHQGKVLRVRFEGEGEGAQQGRPPQGGRVK